MSAPPDDSRLVGYARVSTGGQDLDLQLDAVTVHALGEVFG
jgi:hypothetical protein